jgi:perosamine synthetase
LKIGRTIPPAAAPVSARDLFRGVSGLFGDRYLGKIENEIREYFGSDFVFLVSSGRAALVLILKGLSSLQPRKKVLIPAYTCYSVASAVVHAGLEIALCDVDPETMDFDYAQLERLADRDTLCIMSTHLFGIPSDVDRTRAICRQNGIFLVEDAAQAMGVEIAGRMLGTAGDVGFFSLGRGKNITCGSGGIILTSSKEIGESIREYHRESGKEPAGEVFQGIVEAFFMKIFLNPLLYWFPKGLPFLGIGETKFNPVFPVYRLNNFKAGILGSWQERMEEYNKGRIIIGRQYKDALGLRKGRKIYSGDIPYLRFPVYANAPEAKTRACELYGALGVSPMYPDSVNRIDDLRDEFGEARFPGAERIAQRLMTLPTHVIVRERDRDRICHAIQPHCGPCEGERTVHLSRQAGSRTAMAAIPEICDTLKRDVIVSPHDPGIARRFIEEYEKRRVVDNDLQAIYLKLKYFHDPCKYKYLNLIGNLYMESRKPYLAALCFLESVRVHPAQPEIYRKYEGIRDCLQPVPYRDAAEHETLVSVIMGTYNRSTEIIESVDSVLRQTEQDFELIVINDGGEVDVENLLRHRNSPKIKYHKLRENMGHAAVLNEGVRTSKGRFIAYLDDDDVYYPDHLQRLLNALRQGGGKIAYSNTKMVSGSLADGYFRADDIKGFWNVEYDKNKLIANNFISNLSVLHEKSVFSEIGLFVEDLRVVMDWELWLRASLKYDFSHVDAYTGEYRFKAGNITTTNRLLMDFYTKLVRNYYLYYRGLVAKLEYFLRQGMTEAARKVYSDIRDGYKGYFKSPDSSEELLKFSLYYHDNAFTNEIAIDFFNRDTRRYLRYVNDSKRFGLLVPVSHLIPQKVVKVVRKRLEQNHLK